MAITKRAYVPFCSAGCSRGALGQTEKALGAWYDWIQKAREFQLKLIDWYYLPEGLWELPEFWKLLQSGIDRMCTLSLPMPSGFIAGDDRRKLGELASGDDGREAALYFHVARTRGDKRSLESMAQRFPDWWSTDIEVTLQYLCSHGRPPTARELATLVPPGDDW